MGSIEHSVSKVWPKQSSNVAAKNVQQTCSALNRHIKNLAKLNILKIDMKLALKILDFLFHDVREIAVYIL
jgi:hypothetical protein